MKRAGPLVVWVMWHIFRFARSNFGRGFSVTNLVISGTCFGRARPDWLTSAVVLFSEPSRAPIDGCECAVTYLWAVEHHQPQIGTIG